MRGKLFIRRGEGFLGVFLGGFGLMVTRLSVAVYAVFKGKRYGIEIDLLRKED